MGVYFIAAGSSSKNREKTLDKSFQLEEICNFIPSEICDRLRYFFPEGQDIYIWGANERSYPELKKVRESEFVVDVKNKKVIQIFNYCFLIETEDTLLQEHLGWDEEKASKKRRQYKYVYFLKTPRKTKNDKNYFQEAFGLSLNKHWLPGQKYFNNEKIIDALKKTGSKNIEEFLGIVDTNNYLPGNKYIPSKNTEITNMEKEKEPAESIEKNIKPEPPDWVKKNIEEVLILKNDEGHLERDHEILVVKLFDSLGYSPFKDIKHQRGNIDIRIDKNDKTMIVIEVKADWALSKQNRGAREQAFRYALDSGARYVIVTNGDYYCFYDRKKGLSYKDCYAGEFRLSNLSIDGLRVLEILKKSNLK